MTLIRWLFNLLTLMSGGLADMQTLPLHTAPHCTLPLASED